MEYMKALGHEIKPTINRKGEIQVSLNDEIRTEFKMSEIKEMSTNNLQRIKV
jgi:hypothetical protein